MTNSCYVSELFFYPVKSFKGISLDVAVVDEFGITHDRRFMLVDDNNKFITQRTHPQLSQLSVSMNLTVDDELESIDIYAKPLGTLNFNIEQFNCLTSRVCKVKVWADSVDAIVLHNEATQCLSEFIGVHVGLAYMPDSSFRQIDRQFFSEDKRVGFADGYPFLLTSEASLQDLNNRLSQPVSMRNFRPNIVVSGGISPFAEDAWKRMTVGDITFELVKPCSRCVMTTIDLNGVKSEDKEPLMTLSKYRRNDFGICFGQNLVHLSKGVIRKGDFVSFE